MPNTSKHIQIRIPEDELAALDKWRASQQIWARSTAIRKLVADGIKQANKS